MFITRCCYHRKYFNTEKIISVTNDRPREVVYSDGICQDCYKKVEKELTEWEKRKDDCKNTQGT